MNNHPFVNSARTGSSHVEWLSEREPVTFVEEWYGLASTDHFWMRWRMEAFFRMARELELPLRAPWRALDIGGGSGVVRDEIEAGTSWTLDCADLNAAALGAQRKGRGRALYYNILEKRPELAGSYDALVLFDVLEHIDDPEPFLAAARWHLKPGGWIFVNVPALMTLYSVYDEVVGHRRRYVPATLKKELVVSGFDVRDVRFWGFSLLPLALARKGFLALKNDRSSVVQDGFAPPSALFNRVMSGLMQLETVSISRPLSGTSLLSAARVAP